MNILLAPDKFKGSLPAAAVCDALERGWARGDSAARFVRAPIADGGEGFAEALGIGLGGDWVQLESEDPLGRRVGCRYMWIPASATAVLEMSEASGLWRLEPSERNPARANTFGTGRMIRDAAMRGARRILVGLGGSATTDGGMGMASALGYRFLDASGMELAAEPSQLARVERVDGSGAIGLPEVIAACDVRNPLLGERGTASVFSRQKGADESMVLFLEAGLKNLRERVAEAIGRDDSEVAGAGAAGGLGYGLMSFCGAVLEPGFELVAGALNLEGRMAAADLVLTGEGRLDGQTLEGKGPCGVAVLARRMGKPVIAFAGSIAHEPEVLEGFDAVVPIVDRAMSLEEAMAGASELLERAAERAARLWRSACR